MPKFKFEEQGDNEFRGQLVDRGGDSLAVTTYHKKGEDFTALLNVNGGVVGLKRKQAVTLALALLDASEARHGY